MVCVSTTRLCVSVALSAAALCGTAGADIIISEVHPTGSSNGTYGADFFEITNRGASAVDLTGWKVDDNSNAFGSAVALRLVGSLGAGQSAVFMETNASGNNDAAAIAAFKAAWFGADVPVNFLIGTYGGSGIGLSASVDAVNIFDAAGIVQARVDFNAATPGVTFDNAAGLNNTVISQLSIAGVNGAFVSFNTKEVGSPGTVPAPASLSLLGVAALAARRRR